MTAPVVISVAGAPVPKGRPRFNRATGFAYTPGKTRSYEDTLRLAAGDAMIGRLPLEGPLAMSVRAYVPIPASWSRKRQAAAVAGQLLPITRPDADNYLKAALDSLNTIVFRDDSQVVSVSASKAYSDKPRLHIEVLPYSAHMGVPA
jgi:Holliday junction resolvase RusA-like endonuclease